MPEARLERSDQLAGRASPSAFSSRNLPTCRYYPGCLLSGYESRALNFRCGHVEVSQDGRLDGFQIHEIDLPVS